MTHSKPFIHFVLTLLCAGLVFAQGTETVGGPYSLDENTIVLLHFDSDLSNVSDSTADGIGNGNLMYLDNTELGNGSEFGKYIYLDNDARSDSSFVHIVDVAALDLQENFTIEAWMNVFSVGVSNEDWHTYPKLATKGHNYWVGMMGPADLRRFQTGYEKLADGWADSWTNNQTAEVGKWFHIAAIRDDVNNLYIILVHDKDMNLVGYNATVLGDADTERPQINDARLTIGFADEWTDSGLNGLIDELRISNVVRQFPMPPVIKGVLNGVVSEAANNVDIEVNADVVSPSGTISAVTLNYSTGGDFSAVVMSHTDGSVYSGTIPGQPLGTHIKYYITAQNSHGYEVSSQKSVMSDSGAYYGIAVGPEDALVMYLDFENTLYDSAAAHHEFSDDAKPVFSDVAKFGNHSIQFNSDSTSLLKIDKPAPFLAPSDITVDFWINPDSVAFNTALLAKFSEWPQFQDDWRFGYRIWWNWWNGGLTAEFFAEGQPWINMVLDSTMENGKWYHIIFKSSEENSAAYLELYDENDDLIQEKSVFIPSGLVQRAGTFTLGGDLYDYMMPHRYKGKMDNVKIYNYAIDLPPALKKFNEPAVLQVPVGETKTITADIENSIQTVIHHTTDGVSWTDTDMTLTGDLTYSYTVPALEKGKVFSYYITAVNARGKTLRAPNSGVNGIGFAEPQTMTLELDFEEGTGVPTDKSGYENVVTVYGNPTYTTDAAEGSYALYYEGDSSYIRILPPAPFSVSEQMTIDLRFKADGQLPADGTDLIAKYPEPGGWAFGYRVSFQPDGKLWPEYYMVANEEGESDWTWQSMFLANDTRITADAWYRFVMDFGADSLYIKLYDASDNLLDQNSASIAGQHVNQVGGVMTLGRSWWDPAPIFKGSFDNLHIYNYSITEPPVGIEDAVETNMPSSFNLAQNFPNPFNPATEIRFSLPVAQDVKLVIYNILGQKVKTLVKDKLNAGIYTYKWNGTNDFGSHLSSGLYFYRLESSKFTKVRKMMYIR